MVAYESIFILDVEKASTDGVKKTLQTIQDIIKNEGGAIQNMMDWGKKRLAYPVKGRIDGYYAVIEFEITTDKVRRLRELYELNEGVLRYLILRKDNLDFVPGAAPADVSDVGREEMMAR